MRITRQKGGKTDGGISDTEIQRGLDQRTLMPYFCKADIAVMESFGGVLFREHTVAEGYEDCDYWIKNREKRGRYESRL